MALCTADGLATTSLALCTADGLVTAHLLLPNRFEGQLVVGDVAVDPAARLAITFGGGGSLLVDIVSLFPARNAARSGGGVNPWPFRTDLLQMLKDLRPRQGAAEVRETSCNNLQLSCDLTSLLAGGMTVSYAVRSSTTSSGGHLLQPSGIKVSWQHLQHARPGIHRANEPVGSP